MSSNARKLLPRGAPPPPIPPQRGCQETKPCDRCVAKGITCVFDETQDGRRGRKRLLDDLADKADALDTIMRSLKASDDDSLQDLVHLIRTERPLDNVVEQAKRILARNELRSKSRYRLRQAVLRIASLVDEPPYRVPAQPWTTVINDDEAVSHLISVYFTWHHHGYPSVDERCFMQAINAKNLSSPYCSPFLVNAMLFVACMYTDHPSAFADPEDGSTRGAHFMEETIRLWTLEEGRPSLANLQAFPAFISGLVFLELVQLVKKNQKQGRRDFLEPDFQKSYQRALSAIFSLQTEVAIAWMKPFNIQYPACPAEYTESELRMQTLWQPCPGTESKVVIHPCLIDAERFRLFVIASRTLPVVLSGNAQDSPLPNYVILDRQERQDRLTEIEEQLLQWYQELPKILQIQPQSAGDATPPGPLVDLHLAYHSFQINVQSLMLRARGKDDPERRDAEGKIILASQKNAALLEWLQRTVTLKHYSVYVGQASSLSVFNSLEFLDRPESAKTFHIFIVALSSISRRWTLVRGIVKVVWIMLKERELDKYLEPATVSLLKLGAVDNWGSKDHELFEKCAYPNYAAIEEKGRDLVELGDLLQQYAQLQLGDDHDPV
ncbi:hypothetical protein LTR84_001897 [Exophiala bonariae]|uniref:Xylanolytic transcriptional activator regulatory domain-containing protein n=1 Tax=Exophiala bonariae TaxID=1690606 RepID=A0AAV9NBN5_9EURO|nr:hypothetical protein LTR84_001897 [Exophiala bonariae]